MGEELKFPGGRGRRDDGSLDDSIVALMRAAYSPPGGEEYWTALENRIMARVSSANGRDVSWWNVLAPWAKPALIAAATIFALAGLVNQQLGDSDSQFAYDSLLQSSTPEVVSSAQELISVERGVDGATISYFLSH